MVLEAAAGLRAADPSASAEQRLDRFVRDIVASAVPVGDDLVDYTAYPTPAESAVTGVLIDVSLTRTDSIQTRSLATVALAPTADGGELTGSVTLTGLPVDAADGGRTLHTSQLAGDVHVSAPVDISDSGVLQVALTSAAAPAKPTASTPTSTPRTAAELAAARRTYDAALKKARTTYAKARTKAKKSKRRRVAAKKAYDVRRARAKTAYRAAIADVPASAAPPAASATVTGDASTIISTDVGWALTAGDVITDEAPDAHRR